MKTNSKFFLLSCIFMIIGVISGFSAGNKEVPEIPPVTSGTQYLSPNGDGIKDEAVIDFKVSLFVKSDEGYVPEYGLRILSPEGVAVKEVIETEKSDIGWFAAIFRGYKKFELEKEISWDGKDQDENPVADGVYNVKIWVTDSSGNTQELDLDNFIVDIKSPEVTIIAPESMLFSPNDDGIQDVCIIQQVSGTKETEWKGVFTNEAGETVKTFKWDDSVPGDVLWDGKNDEGIKQHGGVYNYSLNSTDLAGNASKDYKLQGITLDARASGLTADIDFPNFSPNGDGIQDTVTAIFKYDQKEDVASWRLSLADQGTVVIKEEGVSPLPDKAAFDGRDSAGKILPEGVYQFNYVIEYKNGWKPVFTKLIKIDLTPPEISVTVQNPIFSPNGDGQKDSTEIKFKSNEKVTWEGAVLDNNGETVIETDWTETTSLVVWDGTNSEGKLMDNGTYYLTAVFHDLAGNKQYSEPVTIKIDTFASSAVLETPPGFSPNDDGMDDSLTLKIEAEQYNDVKEWALQIKNESGRVVKTLSGSENLPETAVWDGSSVIEGEETKTAAEGLYTANLQVEYKKGEAVRTRPAMFNLDVTPPEIDLAVTTSPFAKSDGTIEGEAYISLHVADNSDITDWTVDVLDKSGQIIRSYAGDGDPSGNVVWNTGREGGEALPAAEEFTLLMSVTDTGGNKTTFTKNIPVDILVIKKDGKNYLMVPNIIFGAYKHTLDSKGPAMKTRNLSSLDKVAEIYRRYPQYNLGLEAHALNIYMDNKIKSAKEEKILGPLTERRAQTVEDALIDKGLTENMIVTHAYGGEFPIVSIYDRSVRWKNRRVEFIMIEPDETEQESAD